MPANADTACFCVGGTTNKVGLPPFSNTDLTHAFSLSSPKAKKLPEPAEVRVAVPLPPTGPAGEPAVASVT